MTMVRTPFSRVARALSGSDRAGQGQRPPERPVFALQAQVAWPGRDGVLLLQPLDLDPARMEGNQQVLGRPMPGSLDLDDEIRFASR